MKSFRESKIVKLSKNFKKTGDFHIKKKMREKIRKSQRKRKDQKINRNYSYSPSSLSQYFSCTSLHASKFIYSIIA